MRSSWACAFLLVFTIPNAMAWGKKPENKPPEPQVVAAATTPTENKNLPPEATIDILTSTNALAALLVVLVSYLFVNRNKSGLGLNLSAALLRSDYAKGATAAKKAGGWPEYKLVEKHDLSKDSKRLRFEFPEKGVSKLDVGRHVMCRADINAERVVRPYSPVEFVAGKYLDLVVKAYENAKMSSYLHQLKVGQSIEMFGPVGSLKYSAGSFKHLVFICAGTGVTPVFATAKAVLGSPADAETKLTVLYQNRTVPDILLREELEALAEGHPGRFKLVLACSRAPADFSSPGPVKQISGYIDEAVVSSNLEVAGEASSTKVFVCGPGGFNKGIQQICEGRGYGLEGTKELLHFF